MNIIDVYDIKDAPLVSKTKHVSLKHTLKLYAVVAQLESGEWILVLMRNEDSPLDKAFIITAEEAVMELLESEQEDLLDLPEFADLKSVNIIEVRKRMYAARGWKQTEKV